MLKYLLPSMVVLLFVVQQSQSQSATSCPAIYNNLCLNGGLCLVTGNIVSCLCAAGFNGSTCANQIAVAATTLATIPAVTTTLATIPPVTIKNPCQNGFFFV
jgi:hypothetical protein